MGLTTTQREAMWQAPAAGVVVVSSAPAAEPIDVATAKDHLHIPSGVTAHDTRLTSLITAARHWIEQWYSLALITQTLVAHYEAPPSDGAPLLLPRGPAASITSIVTYDTANAASTLAAAAYLLDASHWPPRVALNSGYAWPTGLRAVDAVLATYVAGYGVAGTNVPTPILQALLLLVAHWFEQREPVITTGAQPLALPLSVESLLAPYRVAGVMA